MKNPILAIAIILTALSTVMTSCTKDVLDPLSEWGGSYELRMDGKVVAKGDTEEIGLLGNLASAYDGEDLGILVANVPLSAGGVVSIDEDSDESGAVTITGSKLLLDDGSDEMYFSISGTITRESNTTIIFEGSCASLGDTLTHTFSGSMESNAFKLI